MQTDQPPARRRLLLPATLLFLAAAAAVWAYAPVLDNFFVCDDFCYLLVGKSILASPRLALHQQALFQLYVGADMRPLGNLLLAGLYALFGTEPRGWYLLLLGLHLVNVWLVWRVLGRWLRDAPVAAVAAALFATAYGVRNGVCWISNLNESLCLALALLAFDLARCSRERFLRCPLRGKEGVAGIAPG